MNNPEKPMETSGQSSEADDITAVLSHGVGAAPADIDAHIRELAHQAAADSVSSNPPSSDETISSHGRWAAWQRRLPVAALLVVSAGVVTQLWQRPAEHRAIPAQDVSGLSVNAINEAAQGQGVLTERVAAARLATPAEGKGGAASADLDPSARLSQIFQTLEQGDQLDAEQQLIDWQKDFPSADVLELAARMTDANGLARLQSLVEKVGSRD